MSNLFDEYAKAAIQGILSNPQAMELVLSTLKKGQKQIAEKQKDAVVGTAMLFAEHAMKERKKYVPTPNVSADDVCGILKDYEHDLGGNDE